MKLSIALFMLLAAVYSQAQTSISNAEIAKARNDFNTRIANAQTRITEAESTYRAQVETKVKLEKDLADLRNEYDAKQKKWNDSTGSTGLFGTGTRGTGNPQYEAEWTAVYNRYNDLEKEVNKARAAVEARTGYDEKGNPREQGQAYKDILAAREAHEKLLKEQKDAGEATQRVYTLLQRNMDAVMLQSNFSSLLTDVHTAKFAMEHMNNKYEQSKLGFLIKSQIAQTLTSDTFCKAATQCKTPTDKPKLSDNEVLNMLKNKTGSSSSILNSGSSGNK